MIGRQCYAERSSQILLTLSKAGRIGEAAQMLNASILLMNLSNVGKYALALHEKGMHAEARRLIILWAVYIRRDGGGLALYWKIRNLEDMVTMH
jgi:hypothetical protein